MAHKADREQVLAFRLASHNLARRLPPGSLLAAAAACGLQNSPPGSAALALNARVRDLSPEEIDRALATEKTLLQMRSLRGAPYVFPTRDAGVFTLGLLPEDEESLRFFILGSGPALDRVGISGTEVVERTGVALLQALDGRMVTFRQLSGELAELVARALSSQQLAAWRSPGGYAPDQSLGEALVHFALYVVALRGLFCFASRQGGEASFVRTDQWLGAPLPANTPEAARAELVRRYLRCYGPTTAGHFGKWAGIAPAAAKRAWRLVESELVEVNFAGRRTWLRQADLQDLESPPTRTGVRLLPPHDPYLQQVDRGTLLPDKALQRRVWRHVGNPGVVLVNGQLAALWRPRKKGKRLIVAIEPVAELAARSRAAIAAEATRLAPFRGCTAADAVFAEALA